MNKENKVLLVTGASSDVGIKLIKKIYKEYATIYLHYGHMNDKLEKTIEMLSCEVDVKPIQADFSNLDDVKSMIADIESYGKYPNSIVHIAAPRIYNKQFHKDEWENYNKGWEISVRSIVLILNSFIKKMSKMNYGRIVFMLTSNTLEKPAKYQASYVTYKYALLGLMKSLSVEYIEKGITVNGVSPNMMETKFLENVPDLIIEQNATSSPIGRNILVDEVIPVIEYMLSDMGESMTGQNIGITGGL